MEYNFLLLMFFIIIALITDITMNKIPNILTITGATSGLIYHLIIHGFHGFFISFLGLVIGFVLFFILYIIKAVHAGDVKLFAVIGSFMGVEFVIYSSFYSIIYAGFIGILILLFRNELFQRLRAIIYSILYILLSKKWFKVDALIGANPLTFPFMLAVVPGILTTYYYFHLY